MISILLATYNGEKYVAGQIESLLSQSVQDFKLYIRDDKSTDSTYSIVTRYAEKYPNKIFTSQNQENTGGAKHNFFKMMIRNKDDYVMLCDQDDIWLPTKIEKSLKKIKEMEQEFGASTPILVHSDLRVVDNELNTISPSYMKMANKSYEKKALNNVVTLNIAAGCTALYNRALAELIQVEPECMVIHDWWLALIASAFGKIGTLNEPTVLYRQHDNNDIGAKKVLSFGYIFRVLTNFNKMAEIISESYRQARDFLNMYYDRLSDEQISLLKAYASIPKLSKIGKLRTTVKNRTYMHGVARKTAQIVVLLR